MSAYAAGRRALTEDRRDCGSDSQDQGPGPHPIQGATTSKGDAEVAFWISASEVPMSWRKVSWMVGSRGVKALKVS